MKDFDTRSEPVCCNECSSLKISFKERKGRPSLWRYQWECEDCGASVGTHSGTTRPLGFMANKATRKLRADVHHLIDQLWRSGYMKRDTAYNWLAFQLELGQPTCHIAELSTEQLKSSLDLIERFITGNAQRIKKAEQRDQPGTKARADSARHGQRPPNHRRPNKRRR